jgi:hypothetical protein
VLRGDCECEDGRQSISGPLMERYERARTHVVVKEVAAFPVWLDRAPLHRVAGPVSLKLDQRGRVTELLTCTPIPRRM